MNIAIIACFAANHRLEYIVDCLKKEHKVTVIKSDFNHITKKQLTKKNNNYTYINAKKYSKNLSFRRMYSHYDFSKKVIKELDNIRPDIIYSLIPPNSLANDIIKYKKRNINVKVIFDIIDLWPETLPFGALKKILPLYFWKRLRDKNLKKADYIVTECDLYQKILGNRLSQNVMTIHLVEKYIGYKNDIDDKTIQLSYLGSINNIIDIDLIVNMLKELRKYKEIKLHIIGDGEKKERFLQQLNQNKILYQYYGKIFDDAVKEKIFNQCQFGINVMKDSTCVGLTLKSIDYFKFGLPIINNIKEDTIKIVEKYKVGFNINKNNLKDTADQIALMEKKDFIKLKENVCHMYKKEFEVEIFKNKIKNIMDKI